MEENTQSAVADAAETADAQSQVSQAEADALAELAQKNAELQDRALRLQAEFDNFRKRTEREKMEFAEYAGEQTVRAERLGQRVLDRAPRVEALRRK